jgi:hypothetical protein
MPHAGPAVGVATLAVLAAACAGNTAARPFHPGASEGGYTVLYDRRGLPPHTADGPCVQITSNAGVSQAETGLGQVDCTGSEFGLNVQETQLDGARIAVWGIIPAAATMVTVARRPATVKDRTYLAVIAKPGGTYVVVASDRSGHTVASLRSDQLPPAVPNVSSGWGGS